MKFSFLVGGAPLHYFFHTAKTAETYVVFVKAAISYAGTFQCSGQFFLPLTLILAGTVYATVSVNEVFVTGFSGQKL